MSTRQQVNKATSRQVDKRSAPARTGPDGRFRGDLPERTFEFAKTVLDLVDDLPSNTKGWAVAKQLIRCGTSIGANIAEARDAFSDAEFAHRCSIARKEAAETRYWLRICHDKRLIRSPHLDAAIGEVEQFVRILGTIVLKLQQPGRRATCLLTC
jgi:four helix bundle protein